MNNQISPLNASHVKIFIPGIAWFFLVLVLMCLPQSDIPSFDTWLQKIYFDKWVHFGLFAVLAFSFFYPVTKLPLSQKVKKKTVFKIAVGTCIWGLVTELIQKYLISDRSFDLLDWGADCLGAIITYLFCRNKFLSFK
jgi:hypothetical protein